jgi:hypothetical protein
MTGMKIKVNKVIRKCSSIRYFVKNLESLVHYNRYVETYL